MTNTLRKTAMVLLCAHATVWLVFGPFIATVCITTPVTFDDVFTLPAFWAMYCVASLVSIIGWFAWDQEQK